VFVTDCHFHTRLIFEGKGGSYSSVVILTCGTLLQEKAPSLPWKYWTRVKAGNTNGRGRLSTVDLLIKVACFVKKEIMLALSKAIDKN